MKVQVKTTEMMVVRELEKRGFRAYLPLFPTTGFDLLAEDAGGNFTPVGFFKVDGE